MDPQVLMMCCLVTALTVTVSTSKPIEADTSSHCPQESCFKRDCSEIYQSNPSASSRDYIIQPRDGAPEFRVYCEMREDGGWTMIQRREDGLVNFYRGWEDYKQGFGNVNSEFWLGNDFINRLTSDGVYELLVEITDAGDITKFARYSHFRIGNEEASNYTMIIGTYSGTAGDSLASYHGGKPFSTHDRDNDSSASINCALRSHAGWWYNACYHSSLNGPYLAPGVVPAANNYKGILWNTYKGLKYSHKRSAMMVRNIGR